MRNKIIGTAVAIAALTGAVAVVTGGLQVNPAELVLRGECTKPEQYTMRALKYALERSNQAESRVTVSIGLRCYGIIRQQEKLGDENGRN